METSNTFNIYLSIFQRRMQSEISREFRNSSLEEMIEYHFGWDQIGQGKDFGKRLRPILLFLSMEASGRSWKDGIPAACAIEFLHNYSLVHDDIEDQDETRHGRVSVWKKFGMAEAINCGDALYGFSFCQLRYLEDKVDPSTYFSIFATFSRAATQLTIGQAADMSFEKKKTISLNEYWQMVKGKTAALFQAATKIGCLLGKTDSRVQKAFTEYGLALGLAFQARDDFLGIWGDPVETGKLAGSDLIKKKKSLPICFGLENDTHFRKIFDKSNLTSNLLREESNALKNNGAYDYTLNTVKEYLAKAKRCLLRTGIQQDAIKMLLELTESMNTRMK